jgi:hypothetical protein
MGPQLHPSAHRRSSRSEVAAVAAQAEPGRGSVDGATTARLHATFGNADVLAALSGARTDISDLVGETMAAGLAGIEAPEGLESNAAMQRALRRSQAAPAPLPSIPRSGGQPLPADHRSRMESAFGRDFGHVRVHTDPAAARAAAELDAHAFALGADLFFADGAFAPGTPEGDRLLAHELTHVVQHDEGRLRAPTSDADAVSSPDDPEEREAYANEDRILAVLEPAAPVDTAPAGIAGSAETAPIDGPIEREGGTVERVARLLGEQVRLIDGQTLAFGDLQAPPELLGTPALVTGLALAGASARSVQIDWGGELIKGLELWGPYLTASGGGAVRAHLTVAPKALRGGTGGWTLLGDLRVTLEGRFDGELTVGGRALGASGAVGGTLSGKLEEAVQAPVRFDANNGGSFELEAHPTAELGLAAEACLGLRFLGLDRDLFVLDVGGKALLDFGIGVGVGTTADGNTAWSVSRFLPQVRTIGTARTPELRLAESEKRLGGCTGPEELEDLFEEVDVLLETLREKFSGDEAARPALPPQEGPEKPTDPPAPRPTQAPSGLFGGLSGLLLDKWIVPAVSKPAEGATDDTSSVAADPMTPPGLLQRIAEDAARTWAAINERLGISDPRAHLVQTALSTAKRSLRTGSPRWLEELRANVVRERFQLGPAISIAIRRCDVGPSGLLLDAQIALDVFGLAPGSTQGDIQLRWDVFHLHALHAELGGPGLIRSVPLWSVASDLVRLGPVSLTGLKIDDGGLSVAKGEVDLPLPDGLEGAPAVAGYVENLRIGETVSWTRLGGLISDVSVGSHLRIVKLAVGSTSSGEDDRAFAHADIELNDVFGLSFGGAGTIAWSLKERRFEGVLSSLRLGQDELKLNAMFCSEGFYLPEVPLPLGKLLPESSKDVLDPGTVSAKVLGLKVSRSGFGITGASAPVPALQLPDESAPIVTTGVGQLTVEAGNGAVTGFSVTVSEAIAAIPRIGGVTGKAGSVAYGNAAWTASLGLLEGDGFRAEGARYEGGHVYAASAKVRADKLLELANLDVGGVELTVTGLDASAAGFGFASASVALTRDILYGAGEASLVLRAPRLTVEPSASGPLSYTLTGGAGLSLFGAEVELAAALVFRGASLDTAASGITKASAGTENIRFEASGFRALDGGGLRVDQPSLTLDGRKLANSEHAAVLPSWLVDLAAARVRFRAESWQSGQGFTGPAADPEYVRVPLFEEGSAIEITRQDGATTIRIPAWQTTLRPSLDFKVPLVAGMGLSVGGGLDLTFGVRGLEATARFASTAGGWTLDVAAAPQLALDLLAYIEAGIYGGVPGFNVSAGVYAGVRTSLPLSLALAGHFEAGKTSKASIEAGFEAQADIAAEAGAYVALSALGFSRNKRFPLARERLASVDLHGTFGYADGKTTRTPEPFPGRRVRVNERLASLFATDEEKALGHVEDQQAAVGEKQQEVRALEKRAAATPDEEAKLREEAVKRHAAAEAEVESVRDRLKQLDKQLQAERKKGIAADDRLVNELDEQITNATAELRLKEAAARLLAGEKEGWTCKLGSGGASEKLEQRRQELLKAGYALIRLEIVDAGAVRAHLARLLAEREGLLAALGADAKPADVEKAKSAVLSSKERLAQFDKDLQAASLRNPKIAADVQPLVSGNRGLYDSACTTASDAARARREAVEELVAAAANGKELWAGEGAADPEAKQRFLGVLQAPPDCPWQWAKLLGAFVGLPLRNGMRKRLDKLGGLVREEIAATQQRALADPDCF